MKRSSLYRTIGLCLALAVFAQLGFAQVQQWTPGVDGEPVEPVLFPDHIIGVGMAFDANNRPATIAFLYEDLNAALLTPGDVILEYRGHPVSTGANLYNLILSLPDVAPGDTVEIVLLKPLTGEVVTVEPVAAVIEPKVTETTFANRGCEEKDGNCLCSKTINGSTCIRRIHSVLGPDGKTVSTSASCDDGASICPPAPKPKKKGK